MYSLSIVIVSALAALVVGIGLGFVLGRRTSPAGQKHREVERQLDEVLQHKKAYEDEVVEHFSDTARLLNKLTESYRDVHNHLAAGATQLCQGHGPVALGRLESRGDSTEIPPHLADIQPPLDYAPKTSPDEKGMLNEEFGLDRPSPSKTEDEAPTEDKAKV